MSFELYKVIYSRHLQSLTFVWGFLFRYPGFVGAIVHDLWAALINEHDDQELTLAITDPLDPMDRAVHKVL